MKSLASAALMFALCTVFCHAQAAAPKPADPPAKIVLPTGPEKDALQAAIHHQDQAAKEVADLQQKVQTLQMQIQTESTRLQEKKTATDKEVSEARAAAFHIMKQDEAKSTLDLEHGNSSRSRRRRPRQLIPQPPQRPQRQHQAANQKQGRVDRTEHVRRSRTSIQRRSANDARSG